MTREQLERLAQLLTDTAQTASTIELRALADGIRTVIITESKP